MSLELNKIAAAVLTAGVVAMGTGFVADLLVKPHPPEEPVYKVALKDDTGGGGSAGDGSGGEEEQAPDLATLLADASASDGENASRACAACHSFNEGGPNKVGPNLYDVMGAKIAGVSDFNYSNALSSKEGEWTYEKMDAWLENPSGWAQGTSMSYNGIKDPEKRADVIAYLRQQGDNPPPLPEPEQQAAEEQAADAGGAAETGGTDQGAGGGDQQAAEGSGEMQSGNGGDAAGDGSGSEQAASDSGSGGADETQTAKADAAEATGGGDSGSGGGSGLEQKIASADPVAGKSAAAVCSACHSFNQGGPNKVGPNLYNVVGAKVAAVEGFNYSNALTEVGGEWTLEKVDAYLKNPNEFAPGNRMTYPGVKEDQKRYDIIAYMIQQSEKASLD
jgi:cytochrome c